MISATSPKQVQHAVLVRNLFLLAAFFALTLSGCANLEGVRDFAKKSAALSSGTEAVQYWASWDKRSKALAEITTGLSKAVAPAAPKVATDDEVKSVLALHGALAAYMSTLGDLADGSLPDVSKQVDGLVENANKFPIAASEGLTEEQAKEKREKINSAYGSLIKLLKLPLQAYQHTKVRQFVEQNDEHVQRIIEGLSLSSRAFEDFFVAERGNVESWYNLNSSLYPAAPSLLAAFQSAEQKSALLQSYDDKAKALKSYRAALKTIGEEHQKLVTGITNFNSGTLKHTLSSLADAREQVIQARDEYRKAFDK